MHHVRVASFIWGKMRTEAWETASWLALRNCSKEVVGEVSGEGGVHAIKHIFSLHKIAAGLMKTAASHEERCHHEEFYCFSRYEENERATQYSCLENLMDRGGWWAPVHGVTKSGTQLSN